ncbi:hypothetical protein ABT187_19660 [Streptomyces sp. NPDC001817]|uniref:hypothetical protein n=1 Tax=Streptomyces sp. NPDC001817 TaxID=3154398 RepID=UPI00331EAAD4
MPRNRPNAAHPQEGRAAADAPPPNVYLPQSASAPAYDEYADPAAAHGWQDAYDRARENGRTRELPAVPAPGEPDVPAGGRAARRRRQRRRPGGRRRMVVVAGVLGLAGTVGVIAALAGGSDAPAPDGSGPAVGRSVTASPRTDTGSPSAGASTAAAGSPAPAPSSSSSSPDVRASRESRGPSGDGRTASVPAPAPTTSRAPAPTATTAAPTASEPGFPGGQGHGHGATKHPH